MLILITGVLNLTFFFLSWKVVSLVLNTWILFLGILFLPLQAFVQFQRLLAFFFLIAEDFFVFTGPEYEHFSFI